MKRTKKEIMVRALILAVGLIIAHFGVTLFILTNMGSDPFNVFVQGIFHTLSQVKFLNFLTHGTTHIAMCFLIIVVLLKVDSSYIKIGTFLCMIFGGPIIDVFSWMLSPIFAHIHFLPIKLIMLAAGCTILAFGMTIVIKSDVGTGPNDLVAIVISDKLHIKFSIMRVIVDASFVLIGFLLGGTFGIGTLVCVGLVGPVAGVFLPMNEKLVEKVVKKFI